MLSSKEGTRNQTKLENISLSWNLCFVLCRNCDRLATRNTQARFLLNIYRARDINDIISYSRIAATAASLKASQLYFHLSNASLKLSEAKP